MLIRPATPADVPSIRALEQQTETAAHWAEREYGALFAADAPPRLALVAIAEEESDRVIGFAIAGHVTSDWEIENVVVAPEKRRQGVGIKIIRKMLLKAQTAGATSVLLEVRESNLPARRLYEKLGFSQQGRRGNYYKNPEEDALLLSFFVTNLRQFNLEAE
ncbi:MAG: ribosomal protein S18-alanine N-acetyltransferase [Candidatus Korobacteraceae bacterium]